MTSSLAGRTEFLFLLLLAQHLLRIAYQDPSSGCTSKTLAVPPGASIATLNKLCATKFRVTQPDTFGLFLYKGQDYQRLPPGALGLVQSSEFQSQQRHDPSRDLSVPRFLHP